MEITPEYIAEYDRQRAIVDAHVHYVINEFGYHLYHNSGMWIFRAGIRHFINSCVYRHNITLISKKKMMVIFEQTLLWFVMNGDHRALAHNRHGVV